MRILVTDLLLQDSDRHMKEIAKRLSLVPITIDRRKRTIVVNYFNVIIDFQKSDVYRLAGLRPDYILTYNSEVSYWARMVGGTLLEDDTDLVRKVLEHCMEVESGSNKDI